MMGSREADRTGRTTTPRIDRREISPVRKPTRSREVNAEKKRRLAPVEMTGVFYVPEEKVGVRASSRRR
jgi:hypothetical protein